MATKTNSKLHTFESILSLYDNKLPFVVAEYILRIYHKDIVCNKPIKYKTLLAPFIEYKNNIKYCFDHPITDDKNRYMFAVLIHIEIDIPIGKEEEFMDKYSNFIFCSSADSSLEWYDDEDYPNKDITVEETKYIGRCKIIL